MLVLHGGASRGERVMVSPTQLSVLRMIPTARAVARAGRGRLAVYRLLNSYRGWDSEHTPVADTDWAIDQVRERYADAPVGLVGHSLGGRAALRGRRQPGGPLGGRAEPVGLPRRRRRPAPAGGSCSCTAAATGSPRRRAPRPSPAGSAGAPTSASSRSPTASTRCCATAATSTATRPHFTAAVLLDDDSLATGPVAQVLAGEPWVEG